MRIAVIGADTRLGKRIAKEAYHRGFEVTAVVRDRALLDSAKYTVLENEFYEFDPGSADLVIDARETEIRIDREGRSILLKPSAGPDPAGRRTGYCRLGKTPGSYLGEADYALAALDAAEDSGLSGGEILYAESDPAPALPEEDSGRRRYVAFPDKGIAGKVFPLVLDSLEEYVVHFVADDRLILAKKGEPFAAYSCQCFNCDDDVWFVTFMRGEECVTLLLDEPQSLVTVIYAWLLPKKIQHVQHRVLFGAIKKPGCKTPLARHGFTDSLVGEKMTWHYSPYVNITHCYYSESYMRNSLRMMQPVPEDAAPEAKFDAEDRVRRWGAIFFEEPAMYIRVNPHLFLFAMREERRCRMDPLQGGGDMVLAVNTRRMRDYGRGFSRGQGVPGFGLISVPGDWDDLPDPMDTAESPYLT